MDKEELLTESETVRHRRLRNQEEWPKLQNFLYDKKRSRVMGNTSDDWSEIIMTNLAYLGVVSYKVHPPPLPVLSTSPTLFKTACRAIFVLLPTVPPC